MSDPLLKNEPDTARFVVYAPDRGILTKALPTPDESPLWSSDLPQTNQYTRFPTFTRAEGAEQLALVVAAGVPSVKLMHLYPSHGVMASAADCNSAGIPVL